MCFLRTARRATPSPNHRSTSRRSRGSTVSRVLTARRFSRRLESAPTPDRRPLIAAYILDTDARFADRGPTCRDRRRSLQKAGGSLVESKAVPIPRFERTPVLRRGNGCSGHAGSASVGSSRSGRNEKAAVSGRRERTIQSGVRARELARGVQMMCARPRRLDNSLRVERRWSRRCDAAAASQRGRSRIQPLATHAGPRDDRIITGLYDRT